MNFVAFTWLRPGIGYRAMHSSLGSTMVGHHDFQSLLRPHDRISTLWCSGVRILVDNQPAVIQPLLLDSGFDVRPYRRINCLRRAAGKVPWSFRLANPSTFTKCRLFTWYAHHSIPGSSHTANPRSTAYGVQSNSYGAGKHSWNWKHDLHAWTICP